MKLTKQKVTSAVKEWQKRLNLSHWDIIINWDIAPDIEDAQAMINIIEGRDSAIIRFADYFFDLSIDEVNNSIAHELIHIHLNDIYMAHYNQTDNSKRSRDSIMQVSYNIEKATDRLATALCKITPLPRALQDVE